MAAAKETRVIDGRQYVLEYPIHGDLALVKAERGDRWGNLVYRKRRRNFGPVMATAAKRTVATVHEVVELGALDPESIVTPGIHVSRIVAHRTRGHAGRRLQGGSMSGNYQRRTKDELARRVAQDIFDGA